jgi:hypothetical protein
MVWVNAIEITCGTIDCRTNQAIAEGKVNYPTKNVDIFSAHQMQSAIDQCISERRGKKKYK